MRKQAYYFSHDSNARQDDKIIALRMKHGWEGYGLYWALIEKLRDSTNYMCVKDYNIIAFDLRVDASKIKSIIEDFELFKFEDKKFFSPSLISRMEIKEEFIDKKTIAGIKGSLIKHKHASRQELDSMTDSEIIALNQQIKELKGAKLSHSYSTAKAQLKHSYSTAIAIKEKESKVKENNNAHELSSLSVSESSESVNHSTQQDSKPAYTPPEVVNLSKEKPFDENDWIRLLDIFNEHTGKKLGTVAPMTRERFRALHRDGYTKSEIRKAIIEACKDQWHKERGYKVLTLDFFTKPENIERYQPSEKKPVKANFDWSSIPS